MGFIIRTKDLAKVYKDPVSGLETKALDNITLDIQQGDFVAIAGPSGSGKTTLLNILGGLDRPSSGELTIDETPLQILSDAELSEMRLKTIGFVFQAYNLLPTLSTLENAEYVALLQGIPEKHRRHEAIQILKDLGLESMIHKRPNQLSAGQQQRVAVARAILGNPKMILADEPTANLDSKTGEDLIQLMYRMNQNLGVTFIFATHDKMVMDKAATLIRLHDGRLEATP
jgi:putative ABC transport system ATP-binding protein